MDTEALLSGRISFTGLGSGTDFATMVEKLVKLERRQIARFELWKDEWEEKKVGFQELNTKLLNLRTDLRNINTMSKFLVKNADSVNKDVLTATANDRAQVGTHSILVNQLAQNHILTGTAGFSRTTRDITGGESRTFEFQYPSDESTISLDVPAGTTLEGLRNMINSHPDNPGVRAGIIKVGDQDYRLQVRGMDLGAGKEVTIVSSDITNLDPAEFSTTQQAQNAQIRIDGFPDDDWIERSTNSITDLIEGVTLTLRDTGTSALNIAVDNKAVRKNIQDFVGRVNDIRLKIKSLTQVVGESHGSILTGNYAIQLIDSRLKTMLASRGTGFGFNNDLFPSLSMAGITTNADRGSPNFGLLEIDERVLDKALKNHPDELAQIFAADHIGSSNSLDFRYFTSVEGITKGGEYVVEYTVSGGRVVKATINGNRALINGDDEFTGRYGFPEGGMAVKVDNLVDGVYRGKVYLKQGKIGDLADALKDLTDLGSGPLNILEKNYDDITDGIDRKIEFEERRIERYERDLRNRFARLESLLGYYDSLGKSLNSQLQTLRNNPGSTN